MFEFNKKKQLHLVDILEKEVPDNLYLKKEVINTDEREDAAKRKPQCVLSFMIWQFPKCDRLVHRETRNYLISYRNQQFYIPN